jgi:hypothetical protein
MLNFCSAPFDTITVNQHGQITSCFCPGWHNYYNMGSLLTHSLDEIFTNADFQNFRNSIIDQSFKYCLKDRCAKMWNLDKVNDLESAIKQPRLPTMLNIQIEKKCNLKCPSCRNEIMWSKEADPEVEEILNKLIDAYQDFDQPVWFQCDLIGDIFASAAYQNFFRNKKLPECFQFNLSTNGTLVTKNLDLLEKIKDQIYSVVVSFDAATEDTYREIRGAKLSLVIDGIKAMQKMNILRINTSFVTQKKNYLELLDHYKMCKELNINYSGVSSIQRLPHMSDEWWQANQIDDNPDVDYDFLISALKTLKQDPKFGLCGGLENLIATKSTSTLN